MNTRSLMNAQSLTCLSLFCGLNVVHAQARPAPAPASQSQALRDAAKALAAKYDYDGANQQLKQAYALDKTTRLQDSATDLTMIGENEVRVGQDTRALDYLQQALPLRRQVGDRKGEAQTLSELGEAYGDLSQHDKALAYCQQALPLRRVGKAKTGTTSNSFLYQGQQFDAASGDYYLRARYYDPSTGRFLSQDIADGSSFLPISLQRYLYAGDDPANNIDPSGTSFFSDLGIKLHKIVSDDFVSKAHAPDTRFGDQTRISTLLGLDPVTGLTLFKPDLTDVSDQARKIVFEIKPFNVAGIREGVEDLARNITILNSLCSGFICPGPGGGPATYTPGDLRDYVYLNGENLPIVVDLSGPQAGYIAIVLPPVEGLIFYIRINKNQVNPVPFLIAYKLALAEAEAAQQTIEAGGAVGDLEVLLAENILALPAETVGAGAAVEVGTAAGEATLSFSIGTYVKVAARFVTVANELDAAI